MKSFHYKAKKGPLEVVEGSLHAGSHEEAIDKVNALGLVPVDIQEESVEGGAPVKKKLPVSGKAVGGRDLLAFYRQTSKLVKSGVPILQALLLIAQQSENERFSEMLKRLHQEVREGNSLSGSLALFPKTFSSFDIGMIQTGEAAGCLEEVLERIAHYHEAENELVSRIRSSLAYPAFIVLVGIFSVVFMLTGVIPKFSRFFADLGQDLPLITRILMGVSGWFERHIGWVIGFTAAAFFIFNRLLKVPATRLRFDRMILGLPLAGRVLLKAEIARMSRTLELLLKSGIPLVKGMKILIPVVKNLAIRSELERCRVELEQGSLLSISLKKSALFPPFVCHFIGIGEESGRLDESLHEIAEWYEKDTAEAVKIMLSLLEPAVILVIGIILAFIIMAVMLPVFSINTMVV